MTELAIFIEAVRQHPIFISLAKQGLNMAVKGAISTMKLRAERLAGIEPTQMQQRIDRVEETLQELDQTVFSAKQLGLWDDAAAARETDESSTENFVHEAVNMAMDSRSEAKRRFIGRLIAARLQCDGTDEAEQICNQALQIIKSLSERQLLALGALSLVWNLGESEKPISDLDDAEQWLAKRHGRAIEVIQRGPSWDDDVLEQLGLVGAVALHLRGGVVMDGPPEHGDAIDRFLAKEGLSLQSLLRSDVDTAAHRKELQRRFPVLMALSALSRGQQSVSSTARFSYRLDSQYLTAAGEMLGEEILAALQKDFSVSGVGMGVATNE